MRCLVGLCIVMLLCACKPQDAPPLDQQLYVWQRQWTPAHEAALRDSRADFSAVRLTADDIAVIAVPSYGGRVPVTAVRRLSAIDGNGAKAILLCVYGNRAYEDTLPRKVLCNTSVCRSVTVLGLRYEVFH